MPVVDVLKMLIAERAKLDAAIAALQGAAPKARAKKVGAPKKRVVSAAARKKMAAAAKARWAARKAAPKKA